MSGGPPFWQGDQRWGGLTLGSGPAHCDEAGCVLCALTAASVRIAKRDLNPGSALAKLRDQPGCFVGDEIVVSLAAVPLGLEAGPLVVNADEIRDMLRNRLSPTSAVLLRLEVTREDTGHKSGHTVLAVQCADTVVECLDSACGDQEGAQNGWCAIALANLCNASLLKWNKVTRTYAVVGARLLWKMGN